MKLILNTAEYNAIRAILVKLNTFCGDSALKNFGEEAIKLAMPTIEEAKIALFGAGTTTLAWTVHSTDIKRLRVEMLAGMSLSPMQVAALFGDGEEKKTYIFKLANDGDMEIEIVISDADNAKILQIYEATSKTLDIVHEHRELLFAAAVMMKAVVSTLKSLGGRLKAIWEPTIK